MASWNKLDAGLNAVYHDYLYEREHGRPPAVRFHPVVPVAGQVGVSLLYTGDLAEIEALGFRTRARWPGGQRVGGIVDLANLERLIEHPGVVRLSVGTAPQPLLDISVGKINVREKVWKLVGDHFEGKTGKGVVVGILDSGIDFTHPYFRQTADAKKTRILRIWDQGLDPQQGGTSPGASQDLGRAGDTYGVHYNANEINAAAEDPKKIRHRDKSGHGTHVASIAAGNGGKKHTYIGVAPEAELIVVKILELEFAPGLDEKTLFEDSINYILIAAGKERPNAPVVVNLSISMPLSPPYGRSSEELFLAETFAPEKVGRAFVAAAGNSAGELTDGDGKKLRKNKHARVHFEAGSGGGTVEIPIEMKEWAPYNGYRKPRRLAFVLYYPLEFAKKLQAAVRFPTQSAFVNAPQINERPSPARPNVAGRPYLWTHATTTAGVDGDIFNLLLLTMTWKGTASSGEHLLGLYTLRLTVTLDPTEAMEAHLYCQQSTEESTMFRVRDEAAGPRVDLQERSLIGAYGGAANVITVAAYDAEKPGLPMAGFSAPGPIVKITPESKPPAKPDITAPGVDVDAAFSREGPCISLKDETTQKQGTSMAAPHVAGAVALLFEKNKKLTSGDVSRILRDSADPPAEAPEIAGKGRMNVQKAVDTTPDP